MDLTATCFLPEHWIMCMVYFCSGNLVEAAEVTRLLASVRMNFDRLSCHVNPQSSVELGRTIALHESIKLSNRRRQNCLLDLVRLIVNQ